MLTICPGLNTFWLFWAFPRQDFQPSGHSGARMGFQRCNALPSVSQGQVAMAGLGYTKGKVPPAPSLPPPNLKCLETAILPVPLRIQTFYYTCISLTHLSLHSKEIVHLVTQSMFSYQESKDSKLIDQMNYLSEINRTRKASNNFLCDIHKLLQVNPVCLVDMLSVIGTKALKPFFYIICNI